MVKIRTLLVAREYFCNVLCIVIKLFVDDVQQMAYLNSNKYLNATTHEFHNDFSIVLHTKKDVDFTLIVIYFVVVNCPLLILFRYRPLHGDAEVEND